MMYFMPSVPVFTLPVDGVG